MDQAKRFNWSIMETLRSNVFMGRIGNEAHPSSLDIYHQIVPTNSWETDCDALKHKV